MSDMSKFKVGANTYDIKDKKSRGVPLTWAQYQALSYEEQHNGTAYYITDMDAVYPVDHELNANSRNAVANDIVTPHILAMENVLGAKNTWVYPFADTTKEQSGLIWTDTKGVITVSGNNGNSWSTFKLTPESGMKVRDLFPVAGDWIISFGRDFIEGVIGFGFYIADVINQNMYTNETAIAITDNMMDKAVYFRLSVNPNANISTALTFYPMIRPAGTDPTYVPYSMPNSELTEAVNRGYVEVVGDGVKTFATLLNNLYAMVDNTKITPQTRLLHIHPSYSYYYDLIYSTDTSLTFGSVTTVDPSKTTHSAFHMSINSSSTYSSAITTSGTTITDDSSNVFSSNHRFRIVY